MTARVSFFSDRLPTGALFGTTREDASDTLAAHIDRKRWTLESTHVGPDAETLRYRADGSIDNAAVLALMRSQLSLSADFVVDETAVITDGALLINCVVNGLPPGIGFAMHMLFADASAQLTITLTGPTSYMDAVACGEAILSAFATTRLKRFIDEIRETRASMR
jgi:hypothetical protein